MKPLLPRRVDGQGEKGEITVSRDCLRAYVHDGRSRTGFSLRDFSGTGLARVHDDILVARHGPVRIIPFGDSITQTNSYSGIPDDTPRSELWSQGFGFAEQSIFRSGKPYRFLRNAGIAGETTRQMLDRIDSDILAYSPDVVLFMGGTNDILQGQVDQAYADTMNNIETCVIMMLEAGIDVILVTPPAKNGAPDEMRFAIQFYYMLADYYNLPLIDMYKITVDAATGLYKTGYSSDGTHPLPGAIDLMAQYGALVLANPGAYQNPVYLAAYSEATQGNRPNLFSNGSFSLPPSPIDGSFQFWEVNTTGATYNTTAVPVLPFAGKSFTYTKTDNNGAYALFGAGVNTGFVPGDILIASAHLKTTGLATATAQGHTFGLGFDNGDNARLTNVWPYNGDYILSQEIIVPENPGNITPTLYVQDAGTYVVNNITLWNKTAAEAIWQPGLL